MLPASAWVVALHEVDGVLMEIEAQYPHLTAVVTATNSTGLPSDATQRTPPAHVARSDQGPRPQLLIAGHPPSPGRIHR
jgi:hypothetical protein